MLATTLGISAFFVAYFWVMQHPQGEVFIVPLTALDRAVPLDPRTMPLYLSLWLYVSLGPALLRNGRELAHYVVGCFALSAIGLLIFLLWPTTTPEFGIDWSAYPSLAFLKSVDVSANACPSLHVAFAVFTGIWLDRLLREIGLGAGARIPSLLWCAGIAYSTLAVRQHVVLDVAAGAGLGALVALVHLRVVPRPVPVQMQVPVEVPVEVSAPAALVAGLQSQATVPARRQSPARQPGTAAGGPAA